MTVAIALATTSVALLAWTLTGWIRRYALAKSVLDLPNHRSLHSVPVPRGGGAAIVAGLLAGGAVLWAMEVTEAGPTVALIGGTVLIAAVGWVDDHTGLPARWRALAQLIAAIWAVAWLGGVPTLDLGTARVPLGPIGSVLATLGVVWFVNLYNFMDGVDGIAASQAVTAGVSGGVMLILSGRTDLGVLALATAAASLGFLIWNWPPARIFMGDVGSGVLGYVFAILALASERSGAVPLLAWMLLLGVFVFDATLTLVRRLARGERVYEAHRKHAYQRAVQAGFTHRQVTMGVVALNVVLVGLAGWGWSTPARLLLTVGLGLALLSMVYLAVERMLPMRAVPHSSTSRV